MVIDTSAIVAIFFNEPDAQIYRERIADDPVRLISAATLLETAMVIEGRFGEPVVQNSISGCTKLRWRSSR